MTGVELGSGTGARFTICGSTSGGGLITPPLASNFMVINYAIALRATKAQRVIHLRAARWASGIDPVKDAS
jgi:hypothetical protein